MTKQMKIGSQIFGLGKRTYVMGILNVTPDSFSDGGKYNQIDKALYHAKQMVDEGADILDIGGESTRPNHVQITVEEEIERVVTIIEAVKKELDVPISIDTYKSQVAAEALKAGADLVNDIWGLKYDPKMASVIQEYQVPVCLMHNRKEAKYENFIEEAILDLKECVAIAKNAGIEDERIILDPGIGFGKTLEHNLLALAHLEDFLSLGYPLLLGTSRKSVIGLTLDLPVDQREEGTIATTVMGVMKGCHFVRVHNVKGNLRAIKMTEAILNAR